MLVRSDMTARGLDNLAVEHVVLFDFPTSAVDYLYRVGRTGRACDKERLTRFVTKKDVGLARAILEARSGREDSLESARVARESEYRVGRKRDRMICENALTFCRKRRGVRWERLEEVVAEDVGDSEIAGEARVGMELGAREEGEEEVEVREGEGRRRSG